MGEPIVSLEDLINDVSKRHRGDAALARLSDAVRVSEHLGEMADRLVGHFVGQARRAGASWTEIGQGMGVSKQAAQKRFVDKPSDQSEPRARGRFSRFDDQARRVVINAQEQARKAKSNAVDNEHFVLALLRVPEGMAARAIEALGAPLDTVRAAVVAVLPPAEDFAASTLPFNDGGRKVLEQAVREASLLGHDVVGTEHVLLSVLADEKGRGARVLTDLGITHEKVERWIVRSLDDPPHS